MAQSLIVAAQLPSLPMIPIPIVAVCIMFTSLAPSPIAKVYAVLSLFTKLIVYALSSGEDLYIIIDSAFSNNILISWLSSSSFKIMLRHPPFIKRANYFLSVGLMFSCLIQLIWFLFSPVIIQSIYGLTSSYSNF